VSCGLTVAKKEDESTEVILKRADVALYRSKFGGRDRINFM